MAPRELQSKRPVFLKLCAMTALLLSTSGTLRAQSAQVTPPAEPSAVRDTEVTPGQQHEEMLQDMWLALWDLPYVAGRSMLRISGDAAALQVDVMYSAAAGQPQSEQPAATGCLVIYESADPRILEADGQRLELQPAVGRLGAARLLPGADDAEDCAQGLPIFGVLAAWGPSDGPVVLRVLIPMSLAQDDQGALDALDGYVALTADSPLPAIPDYCRQSHDTSVTVCYHSAQFCAFGCALLAPAPPAFASCLGLCAGELTLCLGAAWGQYLWCREVWPFSRQLW